VQEFYSTKSLSSFIAQSKLNNLSIGFVPTMGALHEGHLSLIKAANASCDISVVSIFVNPAQFNDPKDLAKYPRTLEKDLELLKSVSCTAVFIPTIEDVYPYSYSPLNLNVSPVDEVMEGKHRPGHFQGVMNVVHQLFDFVQPTRAFFGRKDFQQVAVIKAMVHKLGLPIQVVMCDTFREASGLAMSSRNLLLSEHQKQVAANIYKTLTYGKSLVPLFSPTEVNQQMVAFFKAFDELVLEYIEIVHPETLLPLEESWVFGATACIVAHCGHVRLIDNLELVQE